MLIQRATKEHLKLREDGKEITPGVMYNKAQTSRIIGCHRDTISYYLKVGHLKGYTSGIRKTYIQGEDILKFLNVKTNK